MVADARDVVKPRCIVWLVARFDPPNEWPLVGREAELQQADALYRQRGNGVVLVGAPGSGKSRLAAEFMGIVGSHGAALASCTATRASRRLPLGAFVPLVRVINEGNGGSSGEPTDLLRRCRDGFLAQFEGRRVALMIDDAHQLDHLSQMLVEDLARSGDVFLIVTVDDDAAGSDFVVSLWKNSGLHRLDVEPLSPETIEALAGAVLDGPVDWATVRQLADASEGKPLFLRELILAALDKGVLRRDLDIWRLVGSLSTSRRITELVQARLADLGPEHRSLLEVIAFGEALRVDDLPQRDDGLLKDLERRSMILAEEQHGEVVVRLAHQVYGQVLRETLPTLRVREILGSLADAVELGGMTGPDDLLRVATWRLEGGGASRPDLLLEAARRATARCDVPLAYKLARRSLELDPTFDAALLSAQLAAGIGQWDQAEAELSQLAREARTDEQRSRVALSRVDNLVHSLRQIDLGLSIAAEAEASVTDPDWRDELAAKRASLLAVTNGPAAAAEVAVPLLDGARGRALVWVSMVSAYALGRLGQFERARAATALGRRAHLECEEAFDWPLWRHDFLDAEELAHEGRFVEAHATSRASYRKAVDERSVEGQAWFAWQLTMHVADRGFPHRASYYGRLAVALFRQLGRTQLEQFALAQLATALAFAGRPSEAESVLSEVRNGGLAETRYFPVERCQAEAWTCLARGDIEAAATRFGEAANIANKTGDAVGEAEALHALARVGRHDSHGRLHEVSETIEGSLAAERFRHAAALFDRDAASLDDVGASFESMGAHVLAAECYASAARLWRNAGDPRRRASSERRARGELLVCENPKGPVALVGPSTAELTPAELRTAALAANGRTSRAIADQLDVSLRTVQNQLQRVYEKLGIRSRAELPQAMMDFDPSGADRLI